MSDTPFTFTIQPISTEYIFSFLTSELIPQTKEETSEENVPTVVNLKAKELRKRGYQNIQEWLDAGDNHLYIGRQIRISLGKGEWAYLKKSKWHNPYKGDRDEVVRKFEEYAREKFSLEDLRELKGKVLGCWCKPEGCHGDILVKLYREFCT